MNAELEPEVIEELQNGRKVNAIKKLRELRGMGLKESKELVDLYCSENDIASPSVEKVSSNNGIILLTVFAIVAYFLYRHFA
jgi:ribosomal protein L7/L12